jgi:hypothetical protein
MRTDAAILAFLIALGGCEGQTGPSAQINPNIVSLTKNRNPFIPDNQRIGIWISGYVFGFPPVRRVRISERWEVTEDTLLVPTGTYLFAYANKTGNKLLLVKSQYVDVSVGALYLYDLQTSELRLLRDSSFKISSAVFLEGDIRCIYYTYGHETGSALPGYYLLDIPQGRDSLVLLHQSEIGPSEVVNGFDVSPDFSRIIIPVHRLAKTAIAIEYNLTTQISDTIVTTFDRQCLWMRYDNEGSRILYGNYPVGVGGGSVLDVAEIGILDKASLFKRIFDVNTIAGGKSINVFPSWSPDNKHIVYASAPGPSQEPPGAKGLYSLYILKGIN